MPFGFEPRWQCIAFLYFQSSLAFSPRLKRSPTQDKCKMEMPEAVVAAVAAYLADFETGRPWEAWREGRSPEYRDCRYYDIRDWHEIKEMARFAATCKMANAILKDELQEEWIGNKEDYEGWKAWQDWDRRNPGFAAKCKLF